MEPGEFENLPTIQEIQRKQTALKTKLHESNNEKKSNQIIHKQNWDSVMNKVKMVISLI